MRLLFTKILNTFSTTLLYKKGIIDKVVTTRRDQVRIASYWVLWDVLFYTWYFVIDISGLRLKELGAFAKKRVLLANCQNSGENVTRHNSVSLRPICFILSGRRSHFDRLILYNQEQRAAAEKSGGICWNTIFFLKKIKMSLFWILHYSASLRPISLMFSGNDRIFRGQYYSNECAGLHFKKLWAFNEKHVIWGISHWECW